MSENDPFGPFGDDDRTVIRPMPGGRRPAPAQTPPAQPAQTVQPAATFAAPPPPPSPAPMPGFNPSAPVALPTSEFQQNPMAAAALSMISLASRLRQTAVYPAVDELRQRLSAEVSGFENKLLQSGTSADHVRMASYALCSFLDETILNTPWGSQSNWGHQSLLISFHKEAWGGEKFFDIIGMLVKQPAQNLHLIELAYLFLSLGFQGKFRILTNGLNELEKYRLELYQLIERVKGDYERELSPRWQGLRDVRNALVRYVPLWVVGAVLGVALILVYIGFVLALNARSDQLFAELFGLGKQPIEIAQTATSVMPVPVAKPVVPERRERFKQLLAKEIAADMVEVVDDKLLRIRNSFASGSDQLKPEFEPMLKKISDELVAGNDRVLVTGHSDNVPIRSARFPSNWHLSTARAKSVSDDMLKVAPALQGKIRSEGRADSEGLVPNDTPEHRAINRRVDLLIQ
ncbi:MAG: type IVB secretion system protein IcmH/DotU [Methylomonas sp.]|jgi:type VI secretion system protein ImpK|uniref:type IVB secretion system protein IcmH/DotU n=1 Tax=Methylomonas sp. TaxID=418 RepID=UPI0025F01648|nr:type IVB secretion system protein IcmH/DotU [Methylomonas sp.]MCK9608283.1 type IVB secretion system protein IcmH/DotU [Methylomonas sp.]